jgi:hypothetical protein
LRLPRKNVLVVDVEAAEESLLEIRKKVVDLEDVEKAVLLLEEEILVEEDLTDVLLIDQTEQTEVLVVVLEREDLLEDLEENVEKVKL